jgi:hypothetical protein
LINIEMRGDMGMDELEIDHRYTRYVKAIASLLGEILANSRKSAAAAEEDDDKN